MIGPSAVTAVGQQIDISLMPSVIRTPVLSDEPPSCVTVPLTVELGSTEMALREILSLGPGSVVSLNRQMGRPLDILVNGELVGRGEVVVVEEHFGVRVTELVRPPVR